jgi:ankyrin repeat protein
MVRLLLDAGADMREVGTVNHCTPLGAAASNGRLDMVQLLLERGVEVDHRPSESYRTAFLAAATAGQPEAARYLVRHGADPTATLGWGADAMHLAAMRNGGQRTIEALVEVGVPVDGKDELGYTAASRAAQRGNVAVLRELLDHGAAVTPDMLLNPDVVEMLVVERGHPPPDRAETRKAQECLDAWCAGKHPVQLERRAVEAAADANDVPRDVALLLGEFVHPARCVDRVE